jgi:hypothetical protein
MNKAHKFPIGASGVWKATVIKADGTEEVFKEGKNTVDAELLAAINDSLLTNNDYAMNNLSSGTLSAGVDGISYTHSGGFLGTSVTTSEPSATSTKFVATKTVSSAVSVTDIQLGHNWATGTSTFTTVFANPSSWATIPLTTGDTLKVEWTITISAV